MKQELIKLAKYLMIPFGAVHLLARPAGPILILMYHRVNDAVSKEISVTQANFRWQMEYLKQKGYQVISLDEALLQQSVDGGRGRGKRVVLTFDDGYEDFFLNAYPVLREYNYPSIVYLVPGYVETGKVFWWDRDAGESRLMSWSQIKLLQQSGIVRFGSHGMTHGDFDKLNREETIEELRSSKEALGERLSADIDNFAYPRGILTPDAVEAAGMFYKSAVSIFDGDEISGNGTAYNKMKLKRVPVQRSDGRQLFHARLAGWLVAEEWLKKAVGRH